MRNGCKEDSVSRLYHYRLGPCVSCLGTPCPWNRVSDLGFSPFVFATGFLVSLPHFERPPPLPRSGDTTCYVCSRSSMSHGKAWIPCRRRAETASYNLSGSAQYSNLSFVPAAVQNTIIGIAYPQFLLFVFPAAFLLNLLVMVLRAEGKSLRVILE